MARTAGAALKGGLSAVRDCSKELSSSVREKERKTDHYEDILGAYLVELSGMPLSQEDSAQAAKLLKVIGDLERIADHAVNLVESGEEMDRKDLRFTGAARKELEVLCAAVDEILDTALTSFLENDRDLAAKVEPLEQVIDRLKERLRTNHILRLQQGGCTMDAGFVWSDLLTDLERTADHCSNIAECVLDLEHHTVGLRQLRDSDEAFRQEFRVFAEKYTLG